MVDRVESWREATFDQMVESVRLGTVFAHDAKQYGKWSRRRKKQRGESVGLTGQALEQAVMSLQMTSPEYIVVGP